jgi:hypothetical protein
VPFSSGTSERRDGEQHAAGSGDRRAWVRRLTGTAQDPAEAKGRRPGQYVRFACPKAAIDEGQSLVSSESMRPASFESWESLLAWAVERAQADLGFVVNTEGFVIATWGEGSSQRWDGLGADLCLSLDEMERADQAAGRLSAICLKFEEHWLVGIRPNCPTRTAYTVGLIAKVLMPEFIENCVAAMTSSLEFLR